MKTQIIATIEPHEDGVRCGECRGPLYLPHLGDSYKCHERTWCPGVGFVRGPECLAADRKLWALVEAGNAMTKVIRAGGRFSWSSQEWDRAVANVGGEG